LYVWVWGEKDGALPACTYFSAKLPDIIEDFLYDLQTEFPDVSTARFHAFSRVHLTRVWRGYVQAMKDRHAFMQDVGTTYDAFMARQETTATASTARNAPQVAPG
jgi:hypothetical protein